MTKATTEEEHPFSTIEVRVGQLPGKIENYTLNGGRTVAHAIEAAKLQAANYEIRVNAEKANAEDELEDGDTVLLVKKIQGNG